MSQPQYNFTVDEAVDFALNLITQGKVKISHQMLSGIRKDTPKVLLAKARARFHCDQDVKIALSDCQKILSKFSKDKNTQAFQCYLHSVDSENKKAERSLGLLKKNKRTDLFFWTDLAHAARNLGQADLAVCCFERGLEIKPDWKENWYNKSCCEISSGKPKEAIASLYRALSYSPSNGIYFKNLAVAYEKLGQFEAVEGNILLASNAGTNDVELKILDAHSTLANADFINGFSKYKIRHENKQFTTIPEKIKDIPIWDGQDLKGKKIVVQDEQGFGDCIQFSRFVPVLEEMGAMVFYKCLNPLKSLMKSSYPTVQIVDNKTYSNNVDYQIHLMDIPAVLKVTLKTIPSHKGYLHASQSFVKKWQSNLEKCSKFKVGIVWQGRPTHGNDKLRSIPFQEFSSLITLEGIDWISLQVGTPSSTFENSTIHDFTNEIECYGDTAALIQQLDMVISVDTSVAHLAGALGKPTWIMLAKGADWRWLLNRNDSPWYSSVHLYRQKELSEWQPTIAQIKSDLEREFRKIPS